MYSNAFNVINGRHIYFNPPDQYEWTDALSWNVKESGGEILHLDPDPDLPPNLMFHDQNPTLIQNFIGICLLLLRYPAETDDYITSLAEVKTSIAFEVLIIYIL